MINDIFIVFLGDLNCPTCALLRGALVGLIGAGIYPILLALPVNAGLAARCVYMIYLVHICPDRLAYKTDLI